MPAIQVLKNEDQIKILLDLGVHTRTEIEARYEILFASSSQLNE